MQYWIINSMPDARSLLTGLLWMALTTAALPCRAQEKPFYSWHAGLEQDVLPYVTGGYFAGAWIGAGHIKTRLLLVKATKPDFLLPDAFTANVIKAYALVLDYHLHSFSEGWWIGGGVVRWDASIRTRTSNQAALYRLHLLHGALGYHISLWHHFYLSPWMGMHLKIDGPDQVNTLPETFHPPLLNPEASVKIGWYF